MGTVWPGTFTCIYAGAHRPGLQGCSRIREIPGCEPVHFHDHVHTVQLVALTQWSPGSVHGLARRVLASPGDRQPCSFRPWQVFLLWSCACFSGYCWVSSSVLVDSCVPLLGNASSCLLPIFRLGCWSNFIGYLSVYVRDSDFLSVCMSQIASPAPWLVSPFLLSDHRSNRTVPAPLWTRPSPTFAASLPVLSLARSHRPSFGAVCPVFRLPSLKASPAC